MKNSYTMAQPFTIDIAPGIITDLKRRLRDTRWPDEVDNDNWQSGTNEAYLKELCRYWEQEYDWEAQQAHLNTFDHFTAEVKGTRLHFLHQKGKGASSIPLLLTHGWPDSFVRFLRIIPLLTAEVDGLSFDVVVPSVPGFGFSERPTEAGMDPKKIAGLFASLMQEELGYKKFVAQGGDWGSTLTEHLALYHADALLGIHLTDVPFIHGMLPVEDPSPAEKKYLEETKMWQQKEGAYNQLQSTKPQSLGYGLNDSPAGLAGWIVEKFHTWTDNDGSIEEAIPRDELLTNLTIYWATQTATSSSRIYYETMKAIMQHLYNPLSKINPFDKTGDRTETPAGFALFPKDIRKPPKEYAERFFNVVHWSKMDKGGHFAAMEEPQNLANDIRSFVKKLDGRSEAG